MHPIHEILVRNSFHDKSCSGLVGLFQPIFWPNRCNNIFPGSGHRESNQKESHEQETEDRINIHVVGGLEMFN